MVLLKFWKNKNKIYIENKTAKTLEVTVDEQAYKFFTSEEGKRYEISLGAGVDAVIPGVTAEGGIAYEVSKKVEKNPWAKERSQTISINAGEKVKAHISEECEGACLTIRDKSDSSMLWCRYLLVRKLGTHIVEGDPYLSDSFYVINETDKTLLVKVQQQENHPTIITVPPNKSKKIEINEGDARLTVNNNDEQEYFWIIDALIKRDKKYNVQGIPDIYIGACKEIIFKNKTDYTVEATMESWSDTNKPKPRFLIQPNNTKSFQIDKNSTEAYFTFKNNGDLKKGWAENYFILIPIKGNTYHTIEGPPILNFT